MNDLVILSDNSSRLSDEAVAEFNTLFIVGKEFPSTVAVREAAKAYGIKHNIAFTTHSATANRIKMICKHAGEYRDTRKAEKEAVQASGKEDTPLPGKERVRRKKSRKCGCQCFVYAAVDRHGRLAVRSREAEHNHTIEEDRKAYAMHRKLTPEALSLVNKHLENNDNAPTIFRILQENGFTNIILRDIENIKQNFAKKDTIKELSTLISALHNLDFFVRLTVPEIETDTDTNIGIGTSANANASTGKWRASPHTVFLIHKNDIEEYDKHLLKAKIFTLIDNVHQPKTEGDIYEQIMAYNVFIQNYCESKGIIAKPFAEEGRVDKKNWLSLYSYKFPYIVSDTYNRYESIHTSLQVDKTFNNPDDNNNDDASDIIVEYDNEDHSDVITAQEPESTRSFSESACIIVRKLTKLFELYVTDTTQQEQDNIQQSIDNLIQAIETSKHNKSSSSTNNLSKRHNRSPKRKLSEVENRLDEILKAPKLPKNTNNTKTGRKKANIEQDIVGKNETPFKNNRLLESPTLAEAPILVEAPTLVKSPTPLTILAKLDRLGIKSGQVNQVFSPQTDGNCGYRAIAMSVYEDETRWPDVKARMLSTFLNHKDTFYKGRIERGDESAFENPMVQCLKDTSSPLDSKHWFGITDHPQIAADAFNRSIAVYWDTKTSYGNSLFVPFQKSPDKIEPIIIFLDNDHFFLIQRKRRNSFKWPQINVYHKAIVQSFNIDDYSLMY